MSRRARASRSRLAAERELLRFVIALGGREPRGGLIEMRYRTPGQPDRMRSSFHEHPILAARALLTLGQLTDVYVGVARRRRPHGGKDAIARGWALWADCDTPAARAALDAFAPPPAIIVRSGTATNCHAYWLLRDPLAVSELEAANRRLAAALGACQSAVTNAAAILRAPGTHSFKHSPPVPITVERLTTRRVDADNVLRGLPELVDEPRRAVAVPPMRSGDPLLALAPAVYVAALTGQRVGRTRKLRCPFHDDDDPSLHVYEQPHDGWSCFGCRRGGSVYDFAAQLWGLDTRGREFLELRRRLYDLLLPGHQPPPGARR